MKITRTLINETIINKVFIQNYFMEELQSEELKKVLSLENDFYTNQKNSEVRKLSQNEISKSEEYLDYDFKNEKLIPLFDIMDNDYLCFDNKKKEYCIFNIIDEISFSNQKDLFVLLESLG